MMEHHQSCYFNSSLKYYLYYFKLFFNSKKNLIYLEAIQYLTMN